MTGEQIGIQSYRRQKDANWHLHVSTEMRKKMPTEDGLLDSWIDECYDYLFVALFGVTYANGRSESKK